MHCLLTGDKKRLSFCPVKEIREQNIAFLAFFSDLVRRHSNIEK